ncbi:MAG: hypothetical protein ABSF22_27420, partial [Bryobacteraceae bacterium]
MALIARHCFGRRRSLPGLTPKIGGHSERLNLVLSPPGPFIAAPVKLAVVQSADGDGELIADL